MKPDVFAVIVAGLVTIAALKLTGARQPFVGPVSNAADPWAGDAWSTPYYLRYNVSAPSSALNMMPIPANYTYALGVPSRPYTQTTAVT